MGPLDTVGPFGGMMLRTRIAGILIACVLAGCSASLEDRKPVPESLVAVAALPGYSDIRFWGDDADSISKSRLETRLAQLDVAAKTDKTINPTDLKFLSVSGGGSTGAFGAGLLVGWTAAGSRPNFDVVTGISTGSLI